MCKKLPLEKQLGEPYRSQWLAMGSGASSAPAAGGNVLPTLRRQNRFVSSEEQAEFELTKKKVRFETYPERLRFQRHRFQWPTSDASALVRTGHQFIHPKEGE